MKSFRIFIILSFACFSTLAREVVKAENGVQFFEGSWAELLATAKEQDKLIFLDVYTDWCPPCKRMDKEVFPLQEVGEKYNAQFLNYKVDAEKGEGVEIARKFGVGAYPTYLYLDTAGYLLQRIVDYTDPASLNAYADKAVELSSESNTLGYLASQFGEGNRAPDFLQAYISKMAGLGMDNSEALNAYIKDVPHKELMKEESLVFLGEHITGTHTYALVFLMAHYDGLRDEVKKKLAKRLFSQVLYRASGTAMKESKALEIRQLITYMEQVEGDLNEKGRNGMNNIKLLYFSLVKDKEQVKQAGHALVGKVMNIPIDSIKAEDARQYNEIMEPFLSGEEDSTKHESFQEDRQYIVNLYSREIAAVLYQAASSFASSLDKGDPALADALLWAERTVALVPGVESLARLVSELEALVGTSESAPLLDTR